MDRCFNTENGDGPACSCENPPAGDILLGERVLNGRYHGTGRPGDHGALDSGSNSIFGLIVRSRSGHFGFFFFFDRLDHRKCINEDGG